MAAAERGDNHAKATPRDATSRPDAGYLNEPSPATRSYFAPVQVGLAAYGGGAREGPRRCQRSTRPDPARARCSGAATAGAQGAFALGCVSTCPVQHSDRPYGLQLGLRSMARPPRDRQLRGRVLDSVQSTNQPPACSSWNCRWQINAACHHVSRKPFPHVADLGQYCRRGKQTHLPPLGSARCSACGGASTCRGASTACPALM